MHNLPLGFFLKKLVTEFLFDPLFFSLILIFAGLAFLSYSRKQRLGRILIGIGAFIITFLSFVDVSTMLVSPLESYHCVYQQKTDRKIDYIVVLSGGADEMYGVPMNTKGNYSTLSRLMEGIRVYRLNPGSKLLLTGGPPEDPSSEIEKKFLVELGISFSDIITDHDSMDTHEESMNVKKIIGDAPFVLVTSATHMPRAVLLFKKQGLNPIPAPTDFIVSTPKRRMPVIEKFPDAGHLISSNMAIHEYIGIAWSWIRGQIE
ncbi:MAG: ElyC/SanA/YdcF family protein [Lentisphaerota bacterium]